MSYPCKRYLSKTIEIFSLSMRQPYDVILIGWFTLVTQNHIFYRIHHRVQINVKLYYLLKHVISVIVAQKTMLWG